MIKNLVLTSDKSSEIYDIPKYILRKSFENEIPKKVLERKIGFPVPLHEWMKEKILKIKFIQLY